MQFQLCRRGLVFKVVTCLTLTLLVGPAVHGDVTVKVNPTRKAFYRGETPWIPVAVTPDPAMKGDARLKATLDGVTIAESPLGEWSAGDASPESVSTTSQIFASRIIN